MKHFRKISKDLKRHKDYSMLGNFQDELIKNGPIHSHNPVPPEGVYCDRLCDSSLLSTLKHGNTQLLQLCQITILTEDTLSHYS